MRGEVSERSLRRGKEFPKSHQKLLSLPISQAYSGHSYRQNSLTFCSGVSKAQLDPRITKPSGPFWL